MIKPRNGTRKGFILKTLRAVDVVQLEAEIVPLVLWDGDAREYQMVAMTLLTKGFTR